MRRRAAARRDVVVVGAGPAGTLTARRLAQAGHDVLVLEEHPEVGVPVHCTGVLGLEAFDEFDLPRGTIRTTRSAARFVAGSGASVLVESESIHAAVIERGEFDRTLAEQAAAAGAELRLDAAVADVAAGPREVTIRLAGEGGAIRARACVLACGASYRFNKQLGLGVPKAWLQSAQIDAPFPPVEHIEVHLGRQVAPGGFAWVVPFTRNGTPSARVGLMSVQDAGEHFARFVGGLGTVAPAGLPAPRLKMLPLGPVRRTYVDRVLAVGDAAGLVKPTTGGGIYYALLSGALAAEALDEGLERDRLEARALRVYETRWRERLGPEIRAGLAFRTVASRLDDRAISALVELARVNGLMPLLREHANFNWHRAVALALLRNASFRRIVLSSLLA